MKAVGEEPRTTDPALSGPAARSLALSLSAPASAYVARSSAVARCVAGAAEATDSRYVLRISVAYSRSERSLLRKRTAVCACALRVAVRAARSL